MNLPTIYLLRHGETLWNVEGRYQGQFDSPLTPKGELQAKENALKLAKYIDIKEVKFFSSPLGRARQTANIIAKVNGLEASKIIISEEIQEISYGIFEGKTKVYCQERYAKEFKEREANKFTYRIEGGESYEEVLERLNRWLLRIEEEKVVVVVAHEMINRALRGLYCNLPVKKMLQLRQANDILIKLENSKEETLT